MFAQETLKEIIDRIETLEQQKKEISEEIQEIFTEAKGEGFDVKALRRVLSLRRMKPEHRNELEELVHLYLETLEASAPKHTPSSEIPPHQRF